MIAFDPNDPHIMWYQVWRGHVRRAKEHGDTNNGYCYAACIAQGQYIQELALLVAKKEAQ